MQRRYEASMQPPRDQRVPALLSAPLLALVLASPVLAVHADYRRFEPMAALPRPIARPAVVRDHSVPPTGVPVRLPARVAVPRRLPPVAETQAVSPAVEEMNFLESSPALDIDLQPPGSAKIHVGGWVEMGFGPTSLD